MTPLRLSHQEPSSQQKGYEDDHAMTKPPTDMRQFVCPECDHTIFNRRLPDCEKCGALLPEALRYSEQHLAAIAKEQATQQKRKKRHQASLKEKLRPYTLGGLFDE